MRNSLVFRYEILNNLSPFVGFQLRSQKYPNADDDLIGEYSYGAYAGIDYRFRTVALSPFIAIPLGSSINNYKSPVSVGMHLALLLEP
ncbi:hypothetical protein QA601_15605 [Chitinispirillales bacterium ANBcel5]|uniref:hypothetical protein n=1 Tax=Cellulosispirillum alkaliphilum TaxID=3039283 RepID=UPI002A51A38B|nr:hypothetical protein [Chitinispirillales bacterium ANBcel5]